MSKNYFKYLSNDIQNPLNPTFYVDQYAVNYTAKSTVDSSFLG